MATKTRYEIREYPTPTAFSRSMGRRLRDRKTAAKLVKRLKRMGRDAFMAPISVAA